MLLPEIVYACDICFMPVGRISVEGHILGLSEIKAKFICFDCYADIEEKLFRLSELDK